MDMTYVKPLTLKLYDKYEGKVEQCLKEIVESVNDFRHTDHAPLSRVGNATFRF